MDKSENSDTIRVSTDAFIAMVVTEAEARELANMPSLEEMNNNFTPSEEFQRKMDKLLKQAAHKRNKSDAIKIAKKLLLSMSIILSLVFCMLLPAQAVQEAVVQTFLEWQDKCVSIIFSTDSTSTDASLQVTEGYIPAGFSQAETSNNSLNNPYFVRYENAAGQWYTIYICYINDSQSFKMDNEYSTYYPIKFNGNSAIWGKMSDGSNALVWSHDNFGYQVLGNIDLSELINIAENLKIS